jgi:hypothetical protein
MIWLPGNGSRGAEALIIPMPSLAPQLPALTLTLSTEMVRLAEDGAMFKIARFAKKSGSLRGPQRNQMACNSAEIDNPNSEAPLTDRSEQLIFPADSLLV